MKNIIKHNAFGALVGLVAVVLGFSLSSAYFFTAETWGGILTVSAELGLIATGVTLLMTCREFDLSVGSNFALSAMLLALLISNDIVPSPVAILLTVLVGALIGMINGLITVKMGIPSFITTLGSYMFWRGIVLALSGGWPVTVEDMPSTLAIFGSTFGSSDFPMSIVWWGIVIIIGLVLLNNTRFGNWILATGGNRNAAWAKGVPVERVRIICFIIVGFLSALAGILQFSRLGTMSPTYGVGMELDVIAATVIGGTSLFGGKGTIIGTFFGTLLIGMLGTGLVLAGAPPYWYQAFMGIILISAVVINTKIIRRIDQDGKANFTS